MKRKRPVRGIFAAFLILVSGHALAREGIQISENPAHAWRSPLATQSLLLAVEKSQDRWITVGERGHILYRQGDGPWQQATAPTRALLTGLSFPNARHGWAVGHDAIILATSDGGRIWRKMHQAIDEQRPLLDVHFQNNNTGFAIGAYGYLLRTEDGGASWHSHSVNPDHDFHLNAIATIPAGLCKSVSENSGSSRGGSPIAVPQGAEGEKSGSVAGYMTRFITLSQRSGPQFGGRRSRPGISQTRSKPAPCKEAEINETAVPGAVPRTYIAAEAGYVYRSDDGGNSWQTLDPPYDGSFFGVHPMDRDSVMVFGLRGHLFVSEDAGGHWRSVETGTQATLTSAISLASGRFLLTGHAGTLLLVDADLHRTRRAQLPERKALSDAVEIAPNRVLVVGENGIHTVDLCQMFPGEALCPYAE